MNEQDVLLLQNQNQRMIELLERITVQLEQIYKELEDQGMRAQGLHVD